MGNRHIVCTICQTLREAWPGLGLARQRAIIAASVTVRVLPAGKGKRYGPATVDVQPRW